MIPSLPAQGQDWDSMKDNPDLEPGAPEWLGHNVDWHDIKNGYNTTIQEMQRLTTNIAAPKRMQAQTF